MDLDLFIKKNPKSTKKSNLIKSTPQSFLKFKLEFNKFKFPGTMISQGRFGNVYICEYKTKKFAFKKIQVKLSDEDGKTMTMKEISFWEKMFFLSTKPKSFPNYHGYVIESTLANQKIYDLFYDFYPMNLRNKLESSPNKSLLFNEIKRFFFDLINAFAFLQGHGYAHRDLKPENFLIDENGQIVIIDFGICEKVPLDGDLEQNWTLQGTPDYFSPEMVTAKVKKQKNLKYNLFKSDVFTLGWIVLEMGGVNHIQEYDDLNVLENNKNKFLQLFQEKFATEIQNNGESLFLQLLQRSLCIQTSNRPDFVMLFLEKCDLSNLEKLKYHIYVEDNDHVFFRKQEKQEKLGIYLANHMGLIEKVETNLHKTQKGLRKCKYSCGQCCSKAGKLLKNSIISCWQCCSKMGRILIDFIIKQWVSLIILIACLFVFAFSLGIKSYHLSKLDQDISCSNKTFSKDSFCDNFTYLYMSMKVLISLDCLFIIVIFMIYHDNLSTKRIRKIILCLVLFGMAITRMAFGGLLVNQTTYNTYSGYQDWYSHLDLLQASLEKTGLYDNLLLIENYEIFMFVVEGFTFFLAFGVILVGK